MYALFLCNRTDIALAPWLRAGVDCVSVDLEPPTGSHPRWRHIREDVAHFEPPGRPCFVACFPPCTDIAASGARHFRTKGLGRLIGALAAVEACRRLCEASGAPWFIENPVGVLSSYWREPDYTFEPSDYGEPYSKRTHLWAGGGFVMPPRVAAGDLFDAATMVEPVEGSRIVRMPDSKGRRERREATPRGFAEAVFWANGHRAWRLPGGPMPAPASVHVEVSLW